MPLYFGCYHRASASPGYGTQPLHWHRTQNRPKRWKKVPKVPKKCQKMVLLSAHIERVSVSRMRDFLDGFPQLVQLYFNNCNKTASSFPLLTPIISQVLLPSSAGLPEDFLHLGKGNDNREVEKVEGRRGRGEEEDRGGGRGGEELSL